MICWRHIALPAPSDTLLTLFFTATRQYDVLKVQHFQLHGTAPGGEEPVDCMSARGLVHLGSPTVLGQARVSVYLRTGGAVVYPTAIRTERPGGKPVRYVRCGERRPLRSYPSATRTGTRCILLSAPLAL